MSLVKPRGATHGVCVCVCVLRVNKLDAFTIAEGHSKYYLLNCARKHHYT